MDIYKLKEANMVHAKITEQQYVLDYFSRFDETKGDAIEFLTNYLNGCKNISSTNDKQELAKLCILEIKQGLSDSITSLSSCFDKL